MTALSQRGQSARRRLGFARTRLFVSPVPALPWPWLRITVALLLAVGVNWAFRAASPFFESSSSFFLLAVIAVIASAWLGRFFSGLLTLLISAGLWCYYFSDPPKSFRLTNLEDLRLLALFLGAGVLICLIVEALYAGRARNAQLAAERQHLADSLLTERQRLAALLSNLPGVVWEVEVPADEAPPRAMFFSPNVARLLGHSADELLGDARLWERVLVAEDRDLFLEALREAARGGTPGVVRHRWLRGPGFGQHAGTACWFETHVGSSPRDALPIVRCVSLDITERESVERALARSEAQFRAAADRAPILIWIARPGEGVVWANRAWLEFRGRSLAEEERLGWIDGVHPVDAVNMASEALAVFARREEFRLEFRIRRADGAWRWILTLGVPRLDPDGGFQDYLGFCVDMSDAKQLQLERESLLEGTERARQAAELATRSKDEFLAKVSHELRNPLNGILGWTQLLRRGDASQEDVAKGIELIDLGARALVQLVDDLLDVSRITAGMMRLSLAPTDLKRVVEAACQSVSPSAAAKGVDLDCRIDPSLKPVMGDARRLQQIAWNLLANAVKFTPPGGRVEVRAREENGFDVISVADTGIGIAPDFLPQVFSAFSQQESSSTRRYRGLGLGLSIVHHLVDLHGGRAVATSAGRDCGSTFEIWLPIAQATALDPPPDEAVAGLAGGEDRPLAELRVLLVDDDPSALALVPKLLARAGALVHTAPTAEAGLSAMLSFRPDLLVSDIEMPGTDGYTLLRRIRALQEEEGGAIPAVALTAYVREEERQRILLAGFQAHLAKPVDAGELVETVARLAGRAPAAAARD